MAPNLSQPNPVGWRLNPLTFPLVPGVTPYFPSLHLYNSTNCLTIQVFFSNSLLNFESCVLQYDTSLGVNGFQFTMERRVVMEIIPGDICFT